MRSTIKHIPSGAEYGSRKEAKLMMGHSNYNRAVHNGQILFFNTYAPTDIVF